MRSVWSYCLILSLLVSCSTETKRQSNTVEFRNGIIEVRGNYAGQPLEIQAQYQDELKSQTTDNTSTQIHPPRFVSSLLGAATQIATSGIGIAGGGGIVGTLALALAGIWRERKKTKDVEVRYRTQRDELAALPPEQAQERLKAFRSIEASK